MKRIIDKRRKEKFMIDDRYLNGQARICGWQSTLVYNSLCRHANINQESFPSIRLMMEELAVGRNTILKGIKNLEKYNVIEIEKTRSKNGKWLNNSYTLVDKSDWIKSQVPKEDTASQVPLRTSPCPSQNKTKSPTGTLRKHIEGNTDKETHIVSKADDWNFQKELLKLINDKQKHIRIIGLFVKAKKYTPANYSELQAIIKRNLKVANRLKVYAIKRIIEVLKYLIEQADFKYTLESVEKFIDEDLDTLNNNQITIIK